MHSPNEIVSILDDRQRTAVLDSRKDEYGDGWLGIEHNRLFDNLQALRLTGEPSGQRLTPLGFRVRSILEAANKANAGPSELR